MNQFLDHYISNQITPVKQDISNIKQHFSRRSSLYKTLGLAPMFFRDKKVLEVGPGGGYNPLVTQSFGLAQYDLVEPNQYAIEDINKIFSEYKVDRKNISIHNCMLEDFQTSSKYDILICEGMIPGLHNKEEVLKKFNDLLNPNGIMILTCIDEISYLFEILRHYIASKLVSKENTFDEKLDIYEAAFSSHLDTLKGMSRFKRDWCADNLMGTMHFNYNFSFKECIEFFNKEYTFYNSSPNIFTEYRWYKEIPMSSIEFNNYFIEQFNEKRHNLLHYQAIFKERKADDNNELIALCKKLFSQIEDSVIKDKETNANIATTLDKICTNLISLNQENSVIYDSIREIGSLIKNSEYSVDAVSNKYQNFKEAFGRGTFYISMVKEEYDA
ncbi:MAG: class I SAM-dependent methyltransferase [Sulfurimonas sp.]|jgi:2-polyprenyl-3-methyl-5-hydroxy-6-metoxy-1,4-benzoquinol methylase